MILKLKSVFKVPKEKVERVEVYMDWMLVFSARCFFSLVLGV